MVRQKNRYLLVQLEFEPDILQSCEEDEANLTTLSAAGKTRKSLHTSLSDSSNLPSMETIKSIQQVNAADIYRSLQEAMTQNFGLVGTCTSDVQVRLYDSKTRLAIIKTTRDKYPQVRSCLTFLTEIKQGVESLKVVASTIAVSGSARTARIAAWGEVKKRFFARDVSKSSRQVIEKELKELEDCLDKIDSEC